MKELGSIVSIAEVSHTKAVQELAITFSNGSEIRQTRLWPDVIYRADDPIESLHFKVFHNESFQELLSASPDIAYMVITLCSEFIGGTQLKPDAVALESFVNGEVAVQSQEIHNFDWFDVVKMHCTHSLWKGGMSESKEHIYVRGREGVSCVLYDHKIDSVVLIEEFRIGAVNEPSPWMLGIPTGGLEEGEDPAMGAARECKEEAGVDVLNIQHMLTYKPSPGFTTHKVHLFYAECDASAIKSRINGLDEEGEDIKVSIVAIDDLALMLKNGDIYNGCAIVALMHFMAFHYDRVKPDHRE